MTVRILAGLAVLAALAAPVPAVAQKPKSTAISGGVLCGAPAKWRCERLAPGYNKFYKFVKDHNWTDQNMAIDYCATEKSMRAASSARTASVEAGCCGAVVVQVTCKP